MATYEELLAESDNGQGAYAIGGFQFPRLSPSERAEQLRSKKSEAPARPPLATMEEVLSLALQSVCPVKNPSPLVYAVGSPQEKILQDAVRAICAIRIKGKATVGYDPANPEPFFDACADTARTAQDVEQSLQDPAEAAIAAEIFKLAGFYSGKIHVLTEAAKVEIQIAVIEKVRHVKYLFARQAALGLS